MKRFSLLSLLLAISLVGVCLGWWVEHTRKPEVYYLHFYAKHWAKRSYDPFHPDTRSKDESNDEPVRLTTIAVTPNRPIWVLVPNNYDPTIEMVGELRGQQGALQIQLRIDIGAPDAASRSDHRGPVALETPHAMEDDRFYFVISRSSDAYE